MKTRILSLILGALSFGSLVAAPATPPPAPSAVASQIADLPDFTAKDAFLKFVLTKAEKYSGKVEDTIGKAVDVATQEAPIVVKEYLRWKLWEYGFYVVSLALLVIATCTLFTIGFNKANWDDWGPWNFIVIISGLLSLFSIFGLFLSGWSDDLLHFIQIVVAPRIFILEQVIRLAKGH